MSYAIDANVLIYASDSASVHHGRARDFLAGCAAGGEVLCLAWSTVMAYLRIVTHPAILGTPLSPERAMANVEAILALDHVRVLTEEDGFWQSYCRATEGVVARGAFVSDVHLAALLLQNGVRTLYTSDRDFRKFRFLDVRDPLAG